MNLPASKPRASQRGRRSVPATIRSHLRLTGIREDPPVTAAAPVTRRRRRLVFLVTTIRAARAAIEKIQEDDKDITTAHALDYSNAFNSPNPVLSCVARDEFYVQNKVTIAFVDEMFDFINSDKK